MAPIVHVEPLLPAHLDELAAVLLHPAVYAHIEPALPSVQQFRLGLERSLAGPSSAQADQLWLNYLVRDASGRMVGRLEATVHHGVAEVAFLFGPASWGRGLAGSALCWLHDELQRRARIAEIWATTVAANVRSRSLLQRCGYEPAEAPASHRLLSHEPGDLVFRLRRGAADPWLDRWKTALAAAAGSAPVLEIGCGSGSDTATLLGMGLQVVAFDLSAAEAANAVRAAPGATISVQSVLDPFPLEGTGIGVVVASLSLNYFPWRQTLDILDRIRTTLRVGGLFLARFNSDRDLNFGAVGHPAIEPGFYSVHGQPKRFFAESDLAALFASGWRVASREHMVSAKYGQPKNLWEVAAYRA